MRKIVCLIVFFTMSVSLLGGCETMVRTGDQQKQKYSRLNDINRRLLAEDMDAILLMHEPTNLHHWHIPFE
jgi:hypothetical protein